MVLLSLGAWIITGGTAAGVMELVGEALHDHHLSTGNTDRSQCVALGIASWGVIANNVALDGEGVCLLWLVFRYLFS